MMNQQTRHNNEIISQFTQQAIPFSELPGHLDAMDLLVTISKVNAYSQVLDVASGPGLVATAFAKIAREVECFDLTPAMLEQARQRATAEGLSNISFREGDAMALPYPNNSFDVVVSRYSFHHFLHPERVLAEMIRVCKPLGCVVVADVAIDPECSARYNYLEKLRDSSHVRALSSYEFVRLFTQEAFLNCTQSEYTIDVKLEDQLSVSFPDGDDVNQIRKLIAADIGNNKTGLNPRELAGVIYYSYPISVYAATKKA